jgi:hypothetical protein
VDGTLKRTALLIRKLHATMTPQKTGGTETRYTAVWILERA